MTAIFTDAEAALLERPHISRAWFAKAELPDGDAYFHAGVGDVTVEGHTWTGVSNPLAGQLVSIGVVPQPMFGQAASVNIVLTGANADFIKSVKEQAREIEGRPFYIYWSMFDPETQELLFPMKSLFPRGRMSAPAIEWSGIGRRSIAFTIEALWSTKNFPPGGIWNGAGLRKKYPGALGLDAIDIDVEEKWTV